MANNLVAQVLKNLLIIDYDQWAASQYGAPKSVVYKGIAIWDGNEDLSDNLSDETSRLFSTREQAEAWCNNYTFSDYQLRCGGCEVWVDECKVY